jgi:hypothetical protein
LTGRRANRGRVSWRPFRFERGSNRAAPSPCARVDGLESPRAGEQAIFLGATEPRAARPGRNPPPGS